MRYTNRRLLYFTLLILTALSMLLFEREGDSPPPPYFWYLAIPHPVSFPFYPLLSFRLFPVSFPVRLGGYGCLLAAQR